MIVRTATWRMHRDRSRIIVDMDLWPAQDRIKRVSQRCEPSLVVLCRS